jgi:hypothetical protein
MRHQQAGILGKLQFYVKNRFVWSVTSDHLRFHASSSLRLVHYFDISNIYYNLLSFRVYPFLIHNFQEIGLILNDTHFERTLNTPCARSRIKDWQSSRGHDGFWSCQRGAKCGAKACYWAVESHHRSHSPGNGSYDFACGRHALLGDSK